MVDATGPQRRRRHANKSRAEPNAGASKSGRNKASAKKIPRAKSAVALLTIAGSVLKAAIGAGRRTLHSRRRRRGARRESIDIQNPASNALDRTVFRNRAVRFARTRMMMHVASTVVAHFVGARMRKSTVAISARNAGGKPSRSRPNDLVGTIRNRRRAPQALTSRDPITRRIKVHFGFTDATPSRRRSPTPTGRCGASARRTQVARRSKVAFSIRA